MGIARHSSRAVLLLLAIAVTPSLQATTPDPADHSIRKFLARGDTQHAYRATRRLEAENGKRSGWLEVVTEYSPETGFRYEVTAEGGAASIRSQVLRAVLDRERDAITQGGTARSSLAHANYKFQANGVDDEGLANVLLVPRRKEPELVSGRLFLQPDDGRLVRVQGQLAKSPSFWIKNVEIVRAYERIDGVVVPVALESHAQVRFFGPARLRMTYAYSHIDGRPVSTPTR